MAYTNIDRPQDYFVTTTWTGNNVNGRTISNGEFKPDFLWMFHRSSAVSCPGVVYNSTIGAGTNSAAFGGNANGQYNAIFTSLNYELAGGDFYRYGYLSGLTSTGFTCAAGNDGSGYQNWRHNYNNYTYVAWQWKANGGTTTSVSASGTGANCINASTHQVNQDAGCSIITYTGRADQITVHQQTNLTHGLGVTPDLTIMKKIDGNGDWVVMGKHITTSSAYSANEHLHLNTTAAISGAEYTGYVAPTSTYIYLGDALVNDTGANYVCYAFAEKQGYSKFGKYVGNGNTNGTFVYTGFKPAWVMMKRIDSADNWAIFDNKRSDSSGFNVINRHLRADSNDAEKDLFSYVGGPPIPQIDLLSNGFKQRGSNGLLNASGGTYIYMAFAENPFTTSTGVPTTAR
jgi:hypothetical protein